MTQARIYLVPFIGLVLCLLGCSTPPGGYIDFGPSSDAAASSGDGGVMPAGGLPCNVAQVLASHCTRCHGNPPTNGAPIPLLTLADLTARSAIDPTMNVAQRSLARMQNPASPMPPAPASPASKDEIAVFSAWVAAGTLPGTGCGEADMSMNVPGDMRQHPKDMSPPPPDLGLPACAHPLCSTGKTLDPACDPCVSKVCAASPFCCTTRWSAGCVADVSSICGESCMPSPDMLPPADLRTPPADMRTPPDLSTPPDMSVGHGLPCDVQDLLVTYCQRCHGKPPLRAPIPLVDYSDLIATSAIDPSKTVAQRALIRMQAGTMPPGGGVPAADIAAFQTWVMSGTPMGHCP